MKRSRAFLIPLLVLVLAFAVVRISGVVRFHPPAPSSSNVKEVFQPAGWRVYFSPQGGSLHAIVEQLDQAKTSVLIQAYSFN